MPHKIKMSSLAQVCTAHHVPAEAEGEGTSEQRLLQSLSYFSSYQDISEETRSLSNCLSIRSHFRLTSVPAFSSLKPK